MNCFKNERHAQYLLFLSFLLLQVAQDVGYLIYLQERLGLCIGKLIVDLTIILAITLFSRKYSLENFWYLVLFSRILSVVFIFALSLEFSLVYIALGFILAPHLLHSHYHPAREFLFEFLLRVSIFIALLIISRPYMEPLVFAAAALCQLLYLLEAQIQAKNSPQGEADLLHPSPTSRDHPHLFQSLWSKLQDTPFLLILANRQTLSVQQISQTFKVLLEDQSIDETAQKDFIMSQLKFHIVRQQSHSQQNSAVKKEVVRQRKSFIYFGELSSSIFQEQYTLTEIIQQNQSISLQIYTSYTWQDGQQLILAGSVQFSDQDDDIMIIFNDITCQTELQQKNIKNDFKSKIIESFSHEMRTPLNSAINYLTMALQEESLSESFKQCLLEPALNSLKQQTYLINDIIDFSQFYTGSLKLNNREFILTEFIQEVSELFRLQFEYKQVGFIVDFSQTHSKKFTTDYTRLMQIIVNLLQNALKFSTHGCVMLIIKQVGVNLKFSVQDEGIGIDSLKLTLIRKTLDQLKEAKDFCYQKSWQGFGLLSATLLLSKLAPEGLDHIKISSQGSFRGTKVSIIIENQIQVSPNHQRYLSIQGHSYPNNASMIYVVEPLEQKQIANSCDNNSQHVPQEANLEINLQYLHQVPKLMSQLNIQPKVMQISDQTSMKIKRDIPSIMSYKSKHMSIVQLQQIHEMESEHYLQLFRQRRQCLCMRVLTVDDEIFNQFSVRFILQKLGFEVYLAYNGQQAIEVLKSTKKCGDQCQLFSLVLMDYQMPILDGVQTTKIIVQLISQQILPRIPIFGLTAFTSSTDIDRCLEAGMSKVLGKPLNLGEFKEALTLI